MKKQAVPFPRKSNPKSVSAKQIGVLFDLDGVIIDSEHLMRLALKYAYNEVVGDGEPPYKKYFKHMGDFFPVIMQKLGLPESMWEPYKTFSTQNLDCVKIFPKIIEQLDQLSQFKKVQLGLVTGKDRKRTLHILKYFGIDKYFKTVVTPEMVPRAKPYPDSLLYATDYLNCKVEDSLYIGDAINDMIAANSANINAVMATWGAKVKLAATKKRAQFILKSPAAITPFIEHQFL